MIGPRLRELRELHGLSLRALAAASGVSVALLSQVENGRSEPSIATLRKLAPVFDADIAELFHEPAAPRVHLSRPGTRTILTAPTGMVGYERLTPGRGDLEVLRAVLQPGEASAAEPRGHESTECVYVVAGAVVVEIGAEEHHVRTAESITFDSRLPHRFRNPFDDAAEILVSVTPPTP